MPVHSFVKAGILLPIKPLAIDIILCFVDEAIGLAMGIGLWWERRRPAPLDILAPAMQWGRLRTWIAAVVERSKLQEGRAIASEAYRLLLPRIKVGAAPDLRSDKIGRFTHHVLNSSLPQPLRYLEIGAFEGQSLAFLHSLLNGKVQATVVDPFADYPELAATNMSDVSKTFFANVDAIGATENVRVMRGRSIDQLPKLIDAGEQFDLIYVDGSHATLDVLLDAILGWHLARDGLMVFDDYWYRRLDLGRSFRPKLAVDAFVGAISHEIVVLDVAAQVKDENIGGSSGGALCARACACRLGVL